MSAHFLDLTAVLIVDDVMPSRNFFRDRLGFEVISDVEHNGTIGFSMLGRNDVIVMIQSDASVRDDAGENYVSGPWKTSLYITVNDVEQIVPAIADSDITLPLRKTAYGMHEIGVREPGGNIVTFASRLAEPTA